MKQILLLSIINMFIAAGVANSQILFEDFDTDPGNLPSGWQTVTPTYGSATFKWHPSDLEGNYFMSAESNDGTQYTTEQWLITPAFSTIDLSSVQLAFDNDRSDTPGNDIQVFISADFSGDSASFISASWTEVTGLSLSTGGNTVINNISDISSVAGNTNVYIAFKYTSDGTEGAVWNIDNVSITGISGIGKIRDYFNIYPNPVRNKLNITSKHLINNLSVQNLIGQQILSIKNINSGDFSLNVSNLKEGIYLISIENSDGTSVFLKFLKK